SVIFFEILHERVTIRDNARLNHFTKKIVAFAGPFADAGENRKSFAAFGDVVDQLHDKNRFANARTAKQSDLTTAQKGLDQIDDFNTRLEHLERCRLLIE